MYYIAKSVVSNLPMLADSEKEQHEQARLKAVSNLRRLNQSKNVNSIDEFENDTGSSRRKAKEDLVLDQYENQIALEVVAPDDIPVGFDGR